jgi:flagellar basal-body rod modification protein FlgD
MSSIGTLFPTSSSTTLPSSASSTANNSSTSSTDSLANTSTFLQLLVAQLKNQDPAQPMDGTTFVTQLAQFSDLEQNLASRQDLDAISKQYLGTTPSGSASSSNNSNSASGT